MNNYKHNISNDIANKMKLAAEDSEYVKELKESDPYDVNEITNPNLYNDSKTNYKIIEDLEHLELQCKSVSANLRDTCFDSNRNSIIYSLELISSIQGIVKHMDARIKEIVKQLPKS